MATATMPDAAPVRINGRLISEAEIAQEMQHHPARSMAEARQQAIEALVLHRLLLEEAEQIGIAGGTDDLGDDPRIAALLEREATTPVADEAACRRFYENNRSRFRSRDEYEARHILLVCAPDDLETRDAAKAQAIRIIATLQNEPGLFGALAIAYSACPSRNQGGRLGPLVRGDTVSEFETYVFSLKAGELCPVPIETRYGVHVIALDRKIVGEELPFEAVQSQIGHYLREASAQVAARHYLMRLVGRAKIEGVEMRGAEDVLVQ